jgi:Dna[CI] antecedent, DciA
VVKAWPDAVGAEIVRSAWPARFQRDGTLVVHTRDSVWAFELTQRAGEIQNRLAEVAAIKFVPGPLPEAAVEATPAAPQRSSPPSPEQVELAASWAAAIEDEDLRKIVTKAVEMSLANAPNDRSF